MGGRKILKERGCCSELYPLAVFGVGRVQLVDTKRVCMAIRSSKYNDTSANEDNSFRNHIR
jgi:hypothetical protein